ncbi:MAG: hypothetical protein NC912_03250 [Candidatus Omnitrophica bacterium]|nr:hypothetical protein [Candidatus Omnitrophota bacterium]
MGLEDILKRIAQDIQEKRNTILDQAEKERERIIKEAKEKAKALFDQILLEAETEAKQELERLTIKEKLEAQKEILAFKRKLLDEVFEKVKDRLIQRVPKKRIITLDKEIEQELEKDRFLAEVKLRLEPEVAKLLWQG